MTKFQKLLLASCYVIASILTFAAPDVSAQSVFDQLRNGGGGKVIKIIDGDTVVLADNREVRLVGIQAPKLPLGRKKFKKWPMADEAKELLSNLILNQEVQLGFGGQETDRHGRVLAHLFLIKDVKTLVWIQGRMLKFGLARAYIFWDNRSLASEMLNREAIARDKNLGIWRLSYYQIRRVEEAGRHIGSYQIIDGPAKKVSNVRGQVYINYGQDWRKDFTILIKPRTRKLFDRAGVDYRLFAGKRLRIRGWIKSWNGPMIEVTYPEQIQILE